MNAGVGFAARLLCIVGWVVVLSGLSPELTTATQRELEGSIGFLAGHDSELLADPERLGIVEAVSEDFRIARVWFRTRWRDLAAREDDLDLVFEGATADYGEQVAGRDTDLRLTSRYRTWLSPAWLLESRLAATRFRREELPVFDLNRLTGSALLSVVPAERWLLTARARLAWLDFPGRPIAESGSDPERDLELTLLGDLSRQLRNRSSWGIEAGYRRVTSNDALVEYRGPLVGMHGTVRLARRWQLTASGIYGQRDYDTYGVNADSGATRADTRRDRTLQGAVGIRCTVRPWAEVFMSASGTHQTSNLDGVEFDQLRVQAGLAFTWRRPRVLRRDSPLDHLSPGRPRFAGHDGAAPDARADTSLTPRHTASGYRFRFRAPAARSVAVVGGFNAWDTSRSPLSGPDAQGLWEATIELPPGTWRYAMVIDGRWVKPPAAPRYEDDGFGSTNGILEVIGGPER